MGQTVHRIVAHEMRKISHPVIEGVAKYWLTVPARNFPSGISTSVNARDPVGLNRRVYRDVKESLLGQSSAELGSFDLMNKGITILAEEVRLVSKARGEYDIVIDDEEGGIVDGAHTAKIIWDAKASGGIPEEQHVEVYIRTNISGRMITDIARGLNTSLQVAPKSIYNIDGVFDWLKEAIGKQDYSDKFSWKESDDAEYDVRDLVGVLELVNIFDFDNDNPKHPVSAYEKWSIVLDRFAADFEANRDALENSKYYKLRKLLPDALALWDHIRHDFPEMHNGAGGSAGNLNIVEKAPTKKGSFDFPFGPCPGAQYRLTKGAAFPILGSFRNFVEVDEDSGEAVWRGGFKKVLKAWKDLGPELVGETHRATKEIGRNPDMLGKNRQHWVSLHKTVRLAVLQDQLKAFQKSHKAKD
jgi:predicted Rdx family selenoprotein